MSNFLELLPEILRRNEPFALGIITDIKGSSPQKLGAKAAFFANGDIRGTLGGGCLEAEIQDRARRALRTGAPATFDLVLDHDFGWDDGLICGGKVAGVILPRAAEAAEIWDRISRRDAVFRWGVKDDFSIDFAPSPDLAGWRYQEEVSPPFELWIAGSGHVAQAVARFAIELDFSVTVFDDRPSLANHQYFPSSTRFVVDYWEKLLDRHPPSRPTFGLIVTRGHQHDALVLRTWINRPFAFVGMIGSRRKKRLIFSQFLEEGIATEQQLAQIACPVGLEIASQSVPEIALSILAQLVQQRAAYRRDRTAANSPAAVPTLPSAR